MIVFHNRLLHLVAQWIQLLMLLVRIINILLYCSTQLLLSLLLLVVGTPLAVSARWNTTQSVIVSWNPPATLPMPTGYELFYMFGGNLFSGGNATGVTELTLTTLTFGETYSFFVVAFGNENTIPSARSMTVSPRSGKFSKCVDMYMYNTDQ